MPPTEFYLASEEETRLEPAPVHFACGQQRALGPVRDALRMCRIPNPQAALRISTGRGRARIEGVSKGALDLVIVSHDEPAIREIARRTLAIESLASHRLMSCYTERAETGDWP